jgi:predicted transglutaminase-like cysteine proteinase
VKTQEELENYWNNKHPRNPVIYTGRVSPAKCQCCKQTTVSKRLNLDVKTMLSAHDALCEDIVSRYRLKQNTHDATMLMIQKYVVQNLKYIGDDISKCAVEYWQLPFETIEFKNGDCEDGALLIAALAIHAGIPAFRVRVTAGMVQEAPTAPQGGHAYVSYLRESDNQWVVIDWCYLEDSKIPMERKTLLSKNPYYKEVWFSFNHLHSWSNKSFEFSTF